MRGCPEDTRQFYSLAASDIASQLYNATHCDIVLRTVLCE